MPPLRFSPLQRFPSTGQRHVVDPRFHPRATCAFRFSQPLGALIRPEPAGHISDRSRSWGCALQGVAPLMQPYAVSGAACPLAVRDRPGRPTNHSITVALNPRKQAPVTTAAARTPLTDPSASGLCSARESATRDDGLDRHERVALLSFSPSRGLPPRAAGPAFAAPPLTQLKLDALRRLAPLPQGISPPGDDGPQASRGPSWGFSTS